MQAKVILAETRFTGQTFTILRVQEKHRLGMTRRSYLLDTPVYHRWFTADEIEIIESVFEDVYAGTHPDCKNDQCSCRELRQPLPDASEARASLLM